MSVPRSVNDIIRRHPRERLFVQPSEWTARHLELLQCAFELESDGLPVVQKAARADVPIDPRPYEFWTHEAESLANSETKNTVIRRLLTERNGPFKCIRPFGFFHFSSEHRFRLHGLVFAPAHRQFPSKEQAPIFAFMQRGMIKIQRDTVFPMPRPRRREHRPNGPVILMRALQLKRLDPADPGRDPYILAVLLGLAQAQAEKMLLNANGSGANKKNHEYKVCAILVDEKNAEYMNFYSANISAAFLQQFDYPEALTSSKEPPLSPSLAIHFKKFPYQPYSTLRQRLVDAIAAHQRDG